MSRGHDVADKKFHNVSNRSLFYCIFFKLDNKNFSVDAKLKKFHELFDKHKHTEKGWEKFNYQIDKAPSWSEFDFDLFVYTKKIEFFIVFSSF